MSRWVRDRDEYEHGEKWFSDWHRSQDDDNATMINLDGVGYCPSCLRSVYFVEATKANGRKCADVTERLGQDAGGIEVFVFYRDDTRHPGQILVDWRSAKINLGWVTDEKAWTILCSIRKAHRCGIPVGLGTSGQVIP
jgi:hypothetical protein